MFISPIEGIRSKLSIFSAHVSGVTVSRHTAARCPRAPRGEPAGQSARLPLPSQADTPVIWAETNASFEQMNFMRETKGSFDRQLM